MSQKKQYSALQKRLLLEFIEQNPDIAKNQISNQYTCGDMRDKWIQISSTLNAAPGVQKSWKDWRKSWSDIKSRTKKKLSQNKRSMEETGGGPDITDEVDPIEDRILNVIGGKQLVDGNTEVPEPGFMINVDHDYEKKLDYVEITSSEVNEPASRSAENVVSTPNSTKVRPPIRSGSVARKQSLKASVEASNNLISMSKKKQRIKENYYNKKLQMMEEANKIHSRIADALEKLVEKQ